MSLVLIQKAIKRYGPYKVLAHKAGVGFKYVSDVYTGKKPPSKKLLDALGFERTVTYGPKKDDEK